MHNVQAGFPCGSLLKYPPTMWELQEMGFDPWVGKIPWRRAWHPTPVFLPGKSHGRRSLVGCRPWGREELDTTERLHFPFSLACIEEGNGNPLQCSCLENPRDGGAWWATVNGVAQSRTRLKRLSSSKNPNWMPRIRYPIGHWVSSFYQEEKGKLSEVSSAQILPSS